MGPRPPHYAIERRLQGARKRRLRRRLWLAACVVGVAGLLVALFLPGSERRAAHKRSVVRVPVLKPPGPIPGYLLIADRGNNRALLVDSTRHILWRYNGVRGRRAGYLNTPDGLDLLRTTDAERSPAVRQLIERAARARR